MKTRLLNAGDNAGIKNDPKLFSSPIVKASSEMKIKNGNIPLVMLTASSWLAESNPGAIIFTRAGAKYIPAPTTTQVTNTKTVIV